MNITIRQANPDDYDRVIGDVDDWWGGRQMAAMLPRLFFTHFRPWTYVAVRDHAIVGFIAAFQSQTHSSQVCCHFIGVDPTARGQGIGEALYQRLFSHAAEMGCEEVLAVTAPTNQPSINFHVRVGFDIIRDSYVEDAVPYSADYDGPGEDRVRFRIGLQDHLARSGPNCD
jgi:hypothetical protein